MTFDSVDSRMAGWQCGINDCGKAFDDVESAIIHQSTQHLRHECEICGTIVPEGYLAIRHAFTEHTRSEYVRAYDTTTSAAAEREQIKRDVESVADLEKVVQQLDDVTHLSDIV